MCVCMYVYTHTHTHTHIKLYRYIRMYIALAHEYTAIVIDYAEIKIFIIGYNTRLIGCYKNKYLRYTLQNS